jgi:hypothetical protein
MEKNTQPQQISLDDITPELAINLIKQVLGQLVLTGAQHDALTRDLDLLRSETV